MNPPESDDRDEMIEALEALLVTARAQLAELRTTLTTAIGFLHPGDNL